MKSKLAIGLLIFSSLFSACTKKDNSQDIQPNILFFLIDDQRNDVLSCAGHSIVETPTVDKLAAGGIRFTNAFVTTSICAASRASIITGLDESRHNYTFGKDPVKKEFMIQSYPYLLKQVGYRTGFIGKFGFKIEDKDSFIHEMFDYYKPSPRSTPHFIKQEDGSKRHSAEIKGDQAIEFINANPEDQAFCLSVSFNAVHAVDGNLTPGNDGHYPYPKAVAGLYEGLEMPEPDLSDPEIFENHPDFLKTSMNRERYYWRWDTKEKYQTNLRAYFRMISGYDRVMGRVIGALEEKGIDDNTVIIYSADNGYYMGNRGFAGKWSHYEESIRVPLVIFDPRLSQRKTGRTVNQTAINIDIPSTILDLAGISVPQIYQGASLLPLLHKKKAINWRTDFMIEHRMDNPIIPKYVGIRGDRYVYAIYYEQEPAYEFLHDLKEDPNQLTNLVDNPDYQEILKEMRIECRNTEKEVK